MRLYLDLTCWGYMNMNKLLTAVALLYAVLIAWMPSAMAAQPSAKGAPVDFRACSYRDGKGLNDLKKVEAKFREWANKNSINYSAWTLFPQYHSGADFDVGWLGAWPDGESFGVSMEKWMSSPAAGLRTAFNEVIDCTSRHEMAVSLPINAPEGTPEDGVLMFYQCTLNDGKSLSDAYAAHLDAGQAMKAMGSMAVSWMFQPAVGAGSIDYDYYHVLGFYRYSDLGATMEMYVNGGGQKAQQKILRAVASCQTPVVFDAVSVRARDER